MSIERKLVWRKEPPDNRDYRFAAFAPVEGGLPMKVDLQRALPEVFDQENIGSCVANATSSSARFAARLEKQDLTASRLFVYWNARNLIGETDQDNGCYIRDAFKTISKEGLPDERFWPYNTDAVFAKPVQPVFEVGKTKLAKTYVRLGGWDLQELKKCLADGFPFVFGFTVFNSFFTNWAKVMPLPKKGEAILGGHAVLAIGYDDLTQNFKIKNSWGEDWKGDGHFEMPYSFITSSNCDDFWTLRDIEFVQTEPVPPTPKETTFKEGLGKCFQSKSEFERLDETVLVRMANALGISAGVKDRKADTAKKIFEKIIG